MYNFLLVINSNIGPILHRFEDTVTYWLKTANFSHPTQSFSAFAGNEPFEFMKKFYGS